MRGYTEYRYWDVNLDSYAARVSMADDRGMEFYMIVPKENPKRFRSAIAEAVEAIDMAIEQGCAPGRVRIVERA